MVVSEQIEAEREKRRSARFANHPSWAKWGQFSARLEDEFGPHGPCVCGVCGVAFDDPADKATHLRLYHNATCLATVAPWGESVYEWARA